jgi:polyferredoxin
MMGADSNATANDPEEQVFFASAKKIYPMAVEGTFRRIKWGLLFVTLGIYYLLPFIRWDRGPDAPDQAVLIDLAGRRAYFFFIEIWPQEVYYITGLLILAAMALFLMNAVAGRLWCGYLCPQTVWTDLFTTAGESVTACKVISMPDAPLYMMRLFSMINGLSRLSRRMAFSLAPK